MIKKIKFIVIIISTLTPIALAQQISNFPLEIGNKWFYRGSSTIDDSYYGVIKEITDTLNTGFKEITSSYLYRDSISVKKEYWAFVGGKFFITDRFLSNVDVYNTGLLRDTCIYNGPLWKCRNIVWDSIFNSAAYSQEYSEGYVGHGASSYFIYKTFPEIGITHNINKYNISTDVTVIDSIILSGIFKNGVVLGDTNLSAPPIFVGDGWELQESGTPEHLNAVFFINRYQGTIVGNKGTILKTTNGGQNWFHQYSPLTSTFTDVFFIDRDHGWIVANDDSLLLTTDGGGVWIPVYTRTVGGLFDINFVNKNVGYITGSGFIEKTKDGGKTWARVYSETRTLFAADFYNSKNGICVGNWGIILSSNDSGFTWISRVVNSAARLNDVVYLNSNCIVIVGGVILVSSNNGINWNTQSTGFAGVLNSVTSLGNNNVITVGMNGKILRSTNKGYEWLTQPTSFLNSFNDVAFTDLKTGWIVGSGGIILHTSSVTEVISNPISPYNNQEELRLPIDFKWSSVPNILHYVFQISADRDFSEILLEHTDLLDTSITIFHLEHEKEYFWRVKTVSASGYAYWSPEWKFNVSGNYEILISPTNHSINIPINTALRWNRVLSALSYRVHVSLDSTFNDSTYSYDIEDTVKILEDLKSNNKYYWRVQANLSDGSKFWSNVWQFTTEQLPQYFALYQNYPNPFNPKTIIKFDIAKETKVQLKIYDILGREVATLVNEEKLAGNHNVEFNGSALASGIYFYKVSSQNFTEVKKMILMK